MDADSPSIKLTREVEIPNKPKQAALPEESAVNGSTTNGVITGKRKRGSEEVSARDEPEVKRLAAVNGTHNAPIVLDDPDTGAILIDDD